MTFLKVSNLTKRYIIKQNKIFAIKDLNLEVNEGEFLSIIGPSGSGKSTLLNLIGLLDVPTSGKIYLNGLSIFEKKK